MSTTRIRRLRTCENPKVDRSDRTRVFALPFLLTGVLAASLFAGVHAAGSRPSPYPDGLGVLPATFTGNLPCADCPGIEYHLDVFPRFYFMRMTYLERNTHFDEFGRWTISPDRKKLVLDSGRTSKTQFEIRQEKTLRMLDGDGNAIPTKLDYDLHRAGFSPIQPRVKLEGRYKYAEGQGVFLDCTTDSEWKVVDDKDGEALHKAFVQLRRGAADILFASVDARLAAKPLSGSDFTDRRLTVEGSFHSIPGGSCPSN